MIWSEIWSNFDIVKYYIEDGLLECLQLEPEKIQTTIEHMASTLSDKKDIKLRVLARYMSRERIESRQIYFDCHNK